MRKSYQYIYLENYFHKNVHIQLFNKYFYIKEKSKLCFEDLISVINDFFFTKPKPVYVWLTRLSG
jgi:hypothetical protein